MLEAGKTGFLYHSVETTVRLFCLRSFKHSLAKANKIQLSLSWLDGYSPSMYSTVQYIHIVSLSQPSPVPVLSDSVQCDIGKFYVDNPTVQYSEDCAFNQLKRFWCFLKISCVVWCRFLAVLILSHLSQILPCWSRVCLCRSSSSPACLSSIIAYPEYALAGPDPNFAHPLAGPDPNFAHPLAGPDPKFAHTDYALAGPDPIFAHPKIQLAQ